MRMRIRFHPMVLLFFLWVVPAPPVRAARVLTPEDVARTREVLQVAIQPQGAWIAYTVTRPRIPGRDPDGPAWVELHVVRFDGTGHWRFVHGAVNVAALRWTPDGRFISYLAKRNGDAHRSLYIIARDGGESRRVLQHETDILAYAWRRDGRALVFVAREPLPEDRRELREQGFDQEIYEEDWLPRRLYRVEFPQGPAGPVTQPQALSELPGQPWSAAWHPDGDRLVVDLSPTPRVDDRYMLRRLHVVDARTGRVRTKIHNPGKLGAFAWSPDGTGIAMISAADPHDPHEGRLMWVDPDTGRMRDLLPDLRGHVEAFRFADDGTLYYLASVGVGSQVGRIDPRTGAHQVVLQTHDPVLDGLDLDGSGARLALVGESPRHPREVMALDRAASGPPKRLTDHNPWLAGIKLGRQEVVRWKSRGGLTIEGLVLHPVGPDPGPRAPLIVVAHGGPEAHFKNGWLTRYAYPGQVAAGRGYFVLYPNYRGSTGRGVAFAKADQGDPMGAEFEDVLRGIEALARRGWIDPHRVGITGGSYGGYFTAWAATRYSPRFAAAVMFVGISDQISKTWTSDIPRELEWVHWRTNPLKDWKLFWDRSPIRYVKNARTPLLILHGKRDTRVNPGQSLELYRALKVRGGVPVRLVYYPHEGHGNRNAAARYDYNLRMMRWFDHFLKAGRRDLPPWQISYPLLQEPSGAEQP